MKSYTITLQEDELDFLLWAMGYVAGAVELKAMGEGQRGYAKAKHDQVLPKLMEAKNAG